MSGDYDDALVRVLLDLPQRRQRNAMHVGKNQNLVREGGAGQDSVIDEIEAVTGIEDGRNQARTEDLVHGPVDGNVARCEARVRVVSGQIDRDIVGRAALPQQETDALQVGRDIGHRQPPGIVVAEGRGRVESPARLSGRGR